MSKRSEFPKVSADPLQTIVDHGIPLHKFKNGSRHVKLFQESQVLPRTNDFRPTPLPYKKKFKDEWTEITKAVTDLKDLSRDACIDILVQDMHDERAFEVYDPMKGNALAITDYLDEFELYIFAGGSSLSHLVILESRKGLYDFGSYQTELALDEIKIKETIDLKYPIRQVQLSTLSTSSEIIFVVRTTSSIHLIRFDGTLSLVHKFILPEQSTVHPDIDYSMPIYVEPSPYFKYQYTFTTTNGYTALIDGSNDSILFENVESIPEHINYSSRWRSCGFGKTPTTIYTASPECIKEYTIRDKEIQTKILAAPNDRIVAFKTSDRLLYCFSTLDAMVVMDRLLPERPVVTWLHKMRDGPPTEIIFHPLPDNNWRIIGFSSFTQRITMMHFHYVNDPVKVSAPQVKVLELHNFELSPLKFEEIYKVPNRIYAAGFNMKTSMKGDETKGHVLFSVTRLFEDGSMRVKYIELGNDKNSTSTLQSPPGCELVSSCQTFEDILIQVENAILPECKTQNREHNEVFNMNPINFINYLNKIDTGDQKISDEMKSNIADKVRDLKSSTTYLQLLDKEVPYSKYSLEEWTAFLEEMEVHEEIERARQIDIPGVFHLSQAKDGALRDKLKSAHEKQIQLASLIIRPLKDTTDKFQYLSSDRFHSTTTTKALAELWTIDDTRYDRLLFPQQHQSTERLLETEKFPSVNIYKRQREEEEYQQQESSQRRNMNKSTTELPEIPMPVVVASAPPPVKKKKTVKMSNNSVDPIVLSDDEEDNITPASLALSLLNSQPSSSVPFPSTTSASSSSSSKFASTSTQPLPGAFASRSKQKPAVTKKKKKPKTSGFK